MKQFAALSSLLIALCFLGCHPNPVPVQMGPDVYSAPVVDQKIPDTPVAVKSADPAKPADAAPAIKDDHVEEVIVVPPSAKPTVVRVSRKPRTVGQIAKEIMTNTPTHTIVSDNPGVKVAQPHKSVWWRWLLLLIVILFAVSSITMGIVTRAASFSPWGLVGKIVKRLIARSS